MYLDKGSFEISEGWFCKHVFLILSFVKIYIYPKVSFEMCVLKCIKKILGKDVKIFYKSTSPFMQVFDLQK
jgi:hypothetical protein